MRKQLFFSTVALVLTALVCLAVLSKMALTEMISQRQAEAEANSFRRAAQGLQAVTLSTDGAIDLLLRDPGVLAALSQPYDRKAALSVIRRDNNIETANNSPFINRHWLD